MTITNQMRASELVSTLGKRHGPSPTSVTKCQCQTSGHACCSTVAIAGSTPYSPLTCILTPDDQSHRQIHDQSHPPSPRSVILRSTGRAPGSPSKSSPSASRPYLDPAALTCSGDLPATDTRDQPADLWFCQLLSVRRAISCHNREPPAGSFADEPPGPNDRFAAHETGTAERESTLRNDLGCWTAVRLRRRG